jgi:hypothetical protein
MISAGVLWGYMVRSMPKRCLLMMLIIGAVGKPDQSIGLV